MYFLLCLFSVCFILSCSSPKLESIVWVENNEVEAVIVTADQPFDIAAYAAEELVYHVKLATGVEIPVQKESDDISPAKHRIYIGQSNAARQAGIDYKNLDSEQCVIRTIDADLFIVGNDGEGDPLDFRNHHSGTLWGVYEVLERTLGVLWLWPGELGTCVPSVDKVEVEPWNEKIKPQMVRRNIRTRSPRWRDESSNNIAPDDNKIIPINYRNGYSSVEAYEYYKTDEKIFLRRHRIGCSDDPRPYTGHSFNDWWKEYGREHPEWFQKLPSGDLADKWNKRFLPLYPVENIPPGGWEDHRGPITYHGRTLTSMCVSDTEFHQEIISRWKEQKKVNPDKSNVIRIGENDTPALCTCSECRALDEDPISVVEYEALPEYARVAHTPMNAGRRYALFWKHVYELAAEIDPDVVVTAFIYFNYFVAPEDVKLNKNIVLAFVPWDGWWFPRDPREQQWLREQWQKWRNTGATLYYRPNYMHNGGSMPHVFARQMAEEFQYFINNGTIGTDFDALTGQWAVNGTTLYLLSRLHNRPSDPVDKLLDEYYNAFGPAALHIKAYFDFWEAHATLNRAVYGFGGSLEAYNRFAHKMFPPESFNSAEQILRQAASAVAGNDDKKYIQRIDFLVKGLEHARKVAKLAEILENNNIDKKALHELFIDLSLFRKDTENIHIANFANSAAFDIEVLQQIGKFNSY